jgi:putative ABC transport system permease protein
VGVVLGLAVALVASGALRGLLFDVEPGDPWTYAVITALLLFVALLASALPARRALRINPIDVLNS